MKIRKSGLFLAFLIAAALFLPAGIRISADEPESFSYNAYTARPSVSGSLHVQDGVLADQTGRKVQLRGVSSHGLTWYPDFIAPDFIKGISEDWNSNLLRLAMYSEIYCGEEKEESLQLLEQGIEAAVEADMYVLADWHILHDYDPNMNLAEAVEFFDYISSKYGHLPHLLYEICNEPNGETHWSDVMEYCDVIIPVIRKNDPDAVITVGTPEFDRNLSAAVLRPLPYDNVMYVLHFYAASHHEGLRKELQAALESGLPVFISECGICASDGNGRIDYESAAEWFTFLRDHDLSYAVWSLSDKDESSAFFRHGYQPSGIPGEDDLSPSGRWVRELIRGADPSSIPVPVTPEGQTLLSGLRSWLIESLGPRGFGAAGKWHWLALVSAVVTVIGVLLAMRPRKTPSYDDVYSEQELKANLKMQGRRLRMARILLASSACLTLIYLAWRALYSIPAEEGILPAACSLILLAVEVFGFGESLILYRNLLGMHDHPLPAIAEDEYPEVDIFIATYNEPADLLQKTISGCLHLSYPDPGKVHIWLCDDNRRTEMRALAEKMQIGYFDRPDNTGAKAGNLNAAMKRTHAPYIVTLDADMIVRSDFLLKTIPYFVKAQKSGDGKTELGLLQTPQAFYDPDVFQYALYSEKRAPNEQDFFYRTIEPARTGSNSVIYGGSNTVLSRKALEEIGGFYTGSITEDFATGVLIESKGYVSLGLPEPLASGQTPHTYREHIKQRTRWARGVIATARQLHLLRMPGLSLLQKVNYLSSVVYWYSPLKNLIYILSPLMFAAFAIPVFECSWIELLIFWLPMYIVQDLCLRILSRGSMSMKWSGIYETSVMPHLLMPVIRETLGMTMSAFKVTDKSGRQAHRETDYRSMAPFLVLIAISVFGIIRLAVLMDRMRFISFAVLLFWLIRNLYFLIMSLFLIDGRDGSEETVEVIDAEPVSLTVAHGREKGKQYSGVTIRLYDHSFTVYLDEGEELRTGMPVDAVIDTGRYHAELSGTVTEVHISRHGHARTHTVEILDFHGNEEEYLQILFDRIPSLPQSLHNDFGIIRHLWQNIACRVARTRH